MAVPAASSRRTSSSWADLNSELLVSIAAIAAADGSPLRHYECLRGVCAAWRSALAPPHPCILHLTDRGARSASVFSLPMGRSFHLYTASEALDDRCNNHHPLRKDFRFLSRARVVGSGNGRLAVALDLSDREYMYIQQDRQHHLTFVGRTVGIFLLDPRSDGEVVQLLPPPTSLDEYGCVGKVVFTPDTGHGTVVAACGRKKVSYIDTGSVKGRDMVWTAVDVLHSDGEHLADLALDAGGGRLYCLDSRGGVRVLRIPRNGQDAPAVANEPPLTRLSAVFAQPYDAACTLTFTKRLFFCHGSLYQAWQYTSATVKLCSGFTMSSDEIFVLRYDPRRWPSWEPVKDLGGFSVFIGKNSNPTVVRATGAGAGAIPGVRPDSVYWINWLRIPMVCDVATGTSEPCALSNQVVKGDCWYFGDDKLTT